MKSAHVFAVGCVLSMVGLLGIVFDDPGAEKPNGNTVIVRVKSLSFDLPALRDRGYAYERLDQLTMELLLGAR